MEKKTVRIDIGNEAKEVLKTVGMAVAGVAGLCVAYHFGCKVTMIKMNAGLHLLERVEPGFVGHMLELTKKYDQLYCK